MTPPLTPATTPAMPPPALTPRTPSWARRQQWTPYLFVSPFLILFLVFLLYPLGRSLMLSVHKTAGPRRQIFVGLDNYRFLLGHDLLFLLALWNTVLYTVCFLCLQIPASLGLALLLNNQLVRARSLFRFCFFSTYLVGQVFVSVLFSQLFSKNGLVNEVLGSIGIAPLNWIGSPGLALPMILICSLWLSAGFGMIYFLAALQAVDRQLYDAAEVDGAGRWGSFWHVTLPSIQPVLIYVILVGTIGAFQLFELPFVLFQGPGPGARGLTLVMYLYSAGFESGDLGYASAIGWVLVLILSVIAVAQLRISRATSEG